MSICFSCYQRPSRPAAADCYRLYADWKRMDQKGSCINMDPKVPKFNRFFLSFSFRSAPDFKDSFFIWFVLVFLSSSTTQTSLGWLCREIQKKKKKRWTFRASRMQSTKTFLHPFTGAFVHQSDLGIVSPPPPKKEKRLRKKQGTHKRKKSR